MLGKVDNSKNKAFKQALYMGYCRHLFKGKSELVESIKQLYIARHHFHPDLLHQNDKHDHGSYFITKVDMVLGRGIELLDCDRVAGLNFFYAVPNFATESILDFIVMKETESIVTGSDIVLSSRMSSGSKQAMRKRKAAIDENDSAEKAKQLKLDERVILLHGHLYPKIKRITLKEFCQT